MKNIKSKITAVLLLIAACTVLPAFERNYDKIQQEHMKADGQKFLFRDVFGTEFMTVLNPNVERHDYKTSSFKRTDYTMTYEGDQRYQARRGVDISHHDGEVDWKKLKSDGIEFVILRVGYRGYQSGSLNEDRMFQKNIKDAIEAGLDVGIYIFSQADSEKEALEEAKFVLKRIKKYKITLPVFYDPEIIRDDEARSDNISGQQFTKNAVVFCNAVKQAGYIPGVYSNMLWEAYEFDLEKLSDFVIWYADYEAKPQTPYRFEFWQYAEKDGDIKAPYDMDVMMVKVK